MGEPVPVTEALDAGRRSYEQRAWQEAFAHLSAEDGCAPLGLEDLERLAVAAHLAGRDAECVAIWGRAHRAALDGGDARRAARCAFWLCFGLLLRGEMAPAAGWLTRAQRALDGAGVGDCAERGLLLLPSAVGHLHGGDPDAALVAFTEVLSFGERFGGVDLVALGRLGRGQAMVLGDQRAEGFAELDEIMAVVLAGEVSPMLSGLAYCAVIEMCHLTLDLRRAREWTTALSRWCEDQPQLVMFRGQCLVHRAEILQLSGAWAEALDEAGRAYEELSRPPGHPALGDALYRLAELHRLDGELEQAEDAYRRASEHGRDPQPGLALLRLAQGRADLAASAIRRALDEPAHGTGRAQLLAAHIEIALAGGDVKGARRSVEELAALARELDTPLARAVTGQALGAVLLAEDDAAGALAVLRPAWLLWRDLEVPYEGARVRALVAAACRRLGDEDGAALELEAAAAAFGRLGARRDPRRCAAAGRPRRPAPTSPGGRRPE